MDPSHTCGILCDRTIHIHESRITEPQVNLSAWVFCMSWCANFGFRGARRTSSGPATSAPTTSSAPAARDLCSRCVQRQRRPKGRWAFLVLNTAPFFSCPVQAYDNKMGRVVAIKVVRPRDLKFTDDEEKRLFREARATICVSHPNVVMRVTAFPLTFHCRSRRLSPPFPDLPLPLRRLRYYYTAMSTGATTSRWARTSTSSATSSSWSRARRSRRFFAPKKRSRSPTPPRSS